MPLRPDDPKLSAWLLGELSAEEAAKVERMVAADPALKLASHEIERVQRVLSNALAPQQDRLFPRQRNLIIQEARRMDVSSQVVPFPARPKSQVSWFFPIAAAAVLALASWLLIQLPKHEDAQIAQTDKSTKKPASTGVDAVYWPAPAPIHTSPTSGSLTVTSPVQANPKFPALIDRGFANPLESPGLPLPLHAGTKSLDWVTNAIRGEKRLPHPHAVRFEEILNRFTLRPAGTAALAKGIAVSAEVAPCPWQASGALIVISLRGAIGAERDVVAHFHPDPSAVRSYRLLGYAKAQDAPPTPLDTKLAPAAAHSLVIEVRSDNPSSSLGSIQWSVDGQEAPSVDIMRRADGWASDDARFAALVAASSLWLTDPGSAVDNDILAALIRENRALSISADRADFLRLMEEAMAISAKE